MEISVEERLKAIDQLNSIKGVRINFNKDKPTLDEIKRVQNVVLGALNVRLNMDMITENKHAEAVKYSFEGDIVAIENVLGRSIDETISLKKFIQLKKSAEAKVKPQLTNRKHGK